MQLRGEIADADVVADADHDVDADHDADADHAIIVHAGYCC